MSILFWFLSSCSLLDTELFWLFRYVRTAQYWPFLPACALIPRWARWIRLFVSSLRWWSCHDIRLAVYQPNFASRLSAHRHCRCRLVILHELEDRLATSFLLFAALLRRGASDCVLRTISRGSFWTVNIFWTLSCQLRVVWWLVQYSQVAPCCLWWLHAISFAKMVCLFLCPPKMNRRSSVLRVLRSCFAVNFSGSRKNKKTIWLFFFNTPWSNGVKNTVCLVSRLSRPPAMSPASNMDVKLNEHPRWNTNSYQLWGFRTWPSIPGEIISPVCPWMARRCNNVLQKFWQYWNLVLLLHIQMKLGQSLSVKLLPPSLWNLIMSFGHMIVQ